MLFAINRDTQAPVTSGGAAPANAASAPSSTSVPVNNQNAAPQAPAYTPPQIDMTTAIPPEFRDRPFFKDITFEKLVKDHVNAQELIGKRPAGIPPADAKPEQLEAFFQQVRPKDPSEYVFAETEYSKKHGVDKEFQSAMRGVFHKAGLHKWQVDVLSKGYDEQLSKLVSGAEGKVELSETEFDSKIDSIYGPDRQKALDTAKNLMIEHVPAELKPAIANLSNEALLVLTTTLNAVHKKYIAEDSFPGAQGSAAGGVEDESSLRVKATNLMATKAYNDFRDPQHESVKKQVDEIYQQVKKMESIKK